MSLQLLRSDKRTLGPDTADVTKQDHENVFTGVRCPKCSWRPSSTSLWCCDC